MTREETVSVIRKVYPEISVLAFESAMEVLDSLPTKTFYPIPVRDGSNLVLRFAGYEITIDIMGLTLVQIVYSRNRDHRRRLIKLISDYSKFVSTPGLKMVQ